MVCSKGKARVPGSFLGCDCGESKNDQRDGHFIIVKEKSLKDNDNNNFTSNKKKEITDHPL